MKLVKAVEAHAVFIKIRDANEMPVGLAWQILDHITELEPSAQKFEKLRNDLAKKYGDPDPENPDQVLIRDKDKEPFLKEVEELQNINVKLNGLAKISKSEIIANRLTIPAGSNLAAILDFITDEDPDQNNK